MSFLKIQLDQAGLQELKVSRWGRIRMLRGGIFDCDFSHSLAFGGSKIQL